MASCSRNSNNGGGDDESKKACTPCHSMDPSSLLSDEQIEERLSSSPALAAWKLVDGPPNKLSFSFVAKSFQAAMDSLNAVGAIAEREQHHPDFHLTSYRNVEIVIYTHKVNGITENDLALAEMISKQVPIDYSPKWLKDHPEAATAAS